VVNNPIPATKKAKASKAPTAVNYVKNIPAITNTAKLATNVNVFLLLFKISLLEFEQVKEGTKDMLEIYTEAQPTLNIEGKDIKYKYKAH